MHEIQSSGSQTVIIIPLVIWFILDFQEKNSNLDRDLNHGSPDH